MELYLEEVEELIEKCKSLGSKFLCFCTEGEIIDDHLNIRIVIENEYGEELMR